jgi:hypothetical protein
MGCLEEPTQPSIVLLWSYYTSKDVLVRNSIFIDELDSLLLKPNQKIPKYLFYLPLLIAYHFPGKIICATGLQIGFFAALVQMIAPCLLG